jgi:iron complex transport system ATP-binding protein
MSLYLHPSKGDVRINGHALGTFDIRPVRPRLAYVSASLASELRPALTALEIVMSAKNGALEVWWHEYDEADKHKARECLARMGVAQHANTPLGALSSGEQQRVLLSRALMTDPIAILLDEPSARLDLGGREQLVQILDEFSRENQTLPSVVVTHHVDEIPASTTHCALMRDGVLIASGPLNETLTSEILTATFGMNLVIERRPNGRLGAYAP